MDFEPFDVDETCIDCDACRQIAPATFVEGDGKAEVERQPAGDAERLRAAMALVACPTHSIHGGDATLVRLAARAFPERIDGEVYWCGYCSEESYGATSYLIRRPGGNVLVDSPRAARPLLDRIDALGGVATMFLSHRDDVADHEKIRARFGCERVIHADDVTGETRGVERKIRGADPVALAPDLLVIPTPGHTWGSAVLLHGEYLFTGDHLWGEGDADGDGTLGASRAVAWYDWREQIRSLEKLLAFDFTWVLPGHGRRHHAPSVDVMRADLRALLKRASLRSAPPSGGARRDPPRRLR